MKKQSMLRETSTNVRELIFLRKLSDIFDSSFLAKPLQSFLSKYEDEQTKQRELAMIYFGSWEFSDNKRTHVITIYPDLSIDLDHQAIIYKQVELSTEKFTIQDQFGYHLTIHTDQQIPQTIYDEAEEKTYLLLPKEEDKIYEKKKS
jgi:hypothetical protein